MRNLRFRLAPPVLQGEDTHMKWISTLALGLLLGLAAGPASAQDWQDIGTIGIVPKGDIFVQRLRLDGPVEQLRFEARDGDAQCLNVQAFFRDNERRVIFHGPVSRNAPVVLALEGGDTSIRLLNFRCSGALEYSTIAVSAHIGRFVAEWESRSTLRRTWRAMHNFGSVWLNDWQYVGGRRFQSRYDQNNIPGPDQPVSALALMPIGNDARCRAAQAQLRDGRSLNLPLSRDVFLSHDQYNRVALPQAAHELESLSLDCRATNGGNVMIQVFAAN
jgi:hypothetical protein